MYRLLLSCGCALLAAEALAAPAAVVELLQAPAWREQGGMREALRPGLELASGDSIRTGAGARVLLTLEEGSLVKIGAEAELALDELSPPATADGIFSGVLNVVRGAFRFTTTLAARKRDIRTRLGTATIGIRGTDVWGKSEDSRDFIVLLEGRIEIEREGRNYPMDTPLSLFMAPRDAQPDPIGPVDQAELAVWAQETEPQAGAGVIDESGRYVLQLAAMPQEAAARALAARLGAAGHAATVAAAEVSGRTWWRVAIAGYASRADAEVAAANLRGPFALASPWIERRP